ncbi:Cap-specific mRNA (nucleoside-2'-O-)-methyltransferase 1 [Balamuthia mandrillaris]
MRDNIKRGRSRSLSPRATRRSRSRESSHDHTKRARRHRSRSRSPESQRRSRDRSSGARSRSRTYYEEDHHERHHRDASRTSERRGSRERDSRSRSKSRERSERTSWRDTKSKGPSSRRMEVDKGRSYDYDHYSSFDSSSSAVRQQRRLKEETETYRIRAEEKLQKFDLNHEDLQFVPVASPERMSKAGYCDEQTILSLWQQKNRLDELFDSGHAAVYYKIREDLFPQEKKRTGRLWHKTGDKLEEIIRSVKFFDNLSSRFEHTTFLDVCGGPGAFSQLLLELAPKPCFGYGLTLTMEKKAELEQQIEDKAKSEKDEEDTDKPGSTKQVNDHPASLPPAQWYQRLLQDKQHFVVLNGKDGTGDVNNPENLDDVVERISKARAEEAEDQKKEEEEAASSRIARRGREVDPEREKMREERERQRMEQLQDLRKRVNLVVADGGHEVQKNQKGEHMENYQELFSGHVLLSEIVVMLKTLRPGGNFVCKVYDCFSDLTASALYIMTLLFDEVFIIKPLHSRVVNSERFIVCKRMREHGRSFALLSSVLLELHRKWWDHKEGVEEKHSPKSLLPMEQMKKDKAFMRSIQRMNEGICEKQQLALRSVLREVNHALSSLSSSSNSKESDERKTKESMRREELHHVSRSVAAH